MWEGDFFFFSALKEQLLLIMDYGFNGFVYDKHTAVHFTRHELFDWSHMDYLWIIVMFFISCLNYHSDCNLSPFQFVF